MHEGVIVYEDSPLVRAVKHGHVLIVDEADKAPTNVTCILKTLVESGEMHLADGRRIVTGMLAHDMSYRHVQKRKENIMHFVVHFSTAYFGMPLTIQCVADCFNNNCSQTLTNANNFCTVIIHTSVINCSTAG